MKEKDRLKLVETQNLEDEICHKCNGTGMVFGIYKNERGEEYQGAAKCDCLKRKVLAQKLSCIPSKYKLSTFENFRGGQAGIVQANITGSYWLYGERGKGKTHLLYSQYRECLKKAQSKEIIVKPYIVRRAEPIKEFQNFEMGIEIIPIYTSIT